MHGRLTICLRMLSRGRSILWDPPSICGDSDLRCLNDCVRSCADDCGMRV